MVKLGAIVAAVAFAASLLEQVAGTLGLAAGAVISLGVLAHATRRVGRFLARWIAKTPLARKIDAIVESTDGLREWRGQVDDRLDSGSRSFERLQAQLEVLSEREAAAVNGALRARAHADEMNRRTGWRE